MRDSDVREIAALLEDEYIHMILDGDGHHYKTYTARRERITTELTDGAFEINVIYRLEDAANRFTDLFEEV